MHLKKLITPVFLSMILGGLCHAQPTQLGIDRSAGPARINVQGETNRDYAVFGADAVSGPWTFLSTHTLINSSQTWFDSASAALPNRFYRAVKLDSPTTPEYADDFRLIDHQGISRSLYYFENDATVKAVVLIFTGNGCSSVAQMVSTINTLRTNFAPQGVVFWMIDANPADNRSNIVTEAASLGIANIPILHDRAQLVARAFHASTTPETVCIDKVGWRIFYRGTIDDRTGAAPVPTTQNYLSNALTSFLANGTVTPRETHTNGCAITLTSMPTPDYATDIAPLLQAKCVGCHIPGTIAPFALTNYASVTSNMAKMRLELLKGTMPPWHADYNFQTFTNDYSLSTTQAAMLAKWIDDGGPRGAGADPLTNPPPPLDYPYSWPVSLGTPSNIISIASQAIPAAGVISYKTINYTWTGGDVWLRAAVVRPGTVKVVHHILAYNKSENDTIQSFLTGYAPGSLIGAFPPGTGKLLTNNTVIQFQMHYIAIGVATNDSSQFGLYTTPIAPTYPLVQSSSHSESFCVPTNTSEYQFVATNTLATNVRIYEFSPHLHARAKWFKYEAIYPNSTTEVLLSVPYYEFNWQTSYRLTQPKDLPAGTKIRSTAGWDNSTQNANLMALYTEQSGSNTNFLKYAPDYVNHPELPYPYNTGIVFDQQTWDEMFIGYFNYSVQ